MNIGVKPSRIKLFKLYIVLPPPASTTVYTYICRSEADQGHFVSVVQRNC